MIYSPLLNKIMYIEIRTQIMSVLNHNKCSFLKALSSLYHYSTLAELQLKMNLSDHKCMHRCLHFLFTHTHTHTHAHAHTHTHTQRLIVQLASENKSLVLYIISRGKVMTDIKFHLNYRRRMCSINCTGFA